MTALVQFCLGMIAFALASQASAGLGTSAAADPEGSIWVAYAQAHESDANVHVMRFDAERNAWSEPLRVTDQPEPVSDDGENRPKLAHGAKGEMYVTWTSPTSAKYTGDIRLSRSLDQGRTWSAPITVHRNRQRITHRFESLLVDPAGRLWVTWIDKRDLHAAEKTQASYAGAAIYYAVSHDGGATWQGDFKLADHSCECCRIGLALDPTGRPAALWRHVFPPNERDHAFAWLDPARPPEVQRATFERWTIDACPHRGPSLAIGANGARHAVWFNQLNGESQAFYGQLGESGPRHVQRLPAGAAHADVAVTASSIALAWKRFDGTATRVETWLSHDGGKQFAPGPTLLTTAQSDQPRLVVANQRIVLVWRQTDRTSVVELTRSAQPTHGKQSERSTAQTSIGGALRTFERNTLPQIEGRLRGRAFWVLLWDLECTYCFKSMKNAAEAQRRDPELTIVTIATDTLAQSAALSARLAELGLRSEAYAFSDAPPEALRYAIDTKWAGEKPRAYRYSGSGTRQAVSGVLSVEQLIRP